MSCATSALHIACSAVDLGVVMFFKPHLQPYYKKLGFKEGDFQVSENYYDAVMSLPLYTGLIEANQSYIVKVLTEAIFHIVI